jgi:uncharacterized protein (TIGR03067 family)
MTTSVLLAVATLLAGQPGPKEKSADDMTRLRGTWALVSSTFDGRPTAAEVVKKRKMIFQDGELIAVVDGLKKGSLKITLDPGKSPKQIDLNPGGERRTARGIYALKGDELKLCYGEGGAERPTEFASPEGGRVYLLVLKREKEKP